MACRFFFILITLGMGPVCCGASEKSAEHRPAENERPLDLRIRVLLLEQLADVRLRLDGPFAIVGGDEYLIRETGAGPLELAVVFEPGQIRLPQFEQAPLGAVLQVHSDSPRGIGIYWPDGTWRRYGGRMTLLGGADGLGRLINVVDIEDYLVGVVASELHRGFHPEAFRAQAVAARTYAWYQKRTAAPTALWDLRATQSSQVYLGLDRQEQVPEAVEAVRQTRGVVCTWSSPRGQRIFCAYYCSTCGGCTQAARSVRDEPAIPPLAGGVVCDFCRESPVYRWPPVRIGKETLTERLRLVDPRFATIGPIEKLEVVDMSSCGRPRRIALMDAEGQAITLGVENFRLAVDPTGMSIKSSWFEPVVDETGIALTNGRGFGHGLGLCQYGANGMAKSGASAGAILRHYYPTARLVRAYE